MAALETVLARSGELLDAIVWRNRGRTTALVEQTLLLNPGLAALGPALPAATPVILPPPSAAKPVLETVKLWG